MLEDVVTMTCDSHVTVTHDVTPSLLLLSPKVRKEKKKDHRK